MCVPVLKCRQLQGCGLCLLTPTAVADKNGGPRALRIEMGDGHAAPFLIDMFVYRMITPYCTKFDRLTNRKFTEIVGTRGQILMAKCTKIDYGWGSAPDPAGGAYDAPPDPLVGRGGAYPTPFGAYGASTLAPSALVSAPAAPRPLAPHAFGVRLPHRG